MGKHGKGPKPKAVEQPVEEQQTSKKDHGRQTGRRSLTEPSSQAGPSGSDHHRARRKEGMSPAASSGPLAAAQDACAHPAKPVEAGEPHAGAESRGNSHRAQAKQQQEQQQEASGPDLLALLPVDLLDHVLSLLAAAPGGSPIRRTCRRLRGAFDRLNTRLVLRGGPTSEQCPAGVYACLQALMHDPRYTDLTLTEFNNYPSWLEADGGRQLAQRLERLRLLGLKEHWLGTGLVALYACTRLQRLELRCPPHQRPDPLPPLAACTAMRHLDLCEGAWATSLEPFAEWHQLEFLNLGSAPALRQLPPLPAWPRLLHLSFQDCELEDLSALSACVRLQALHLSRLRWLRRLGPLAACTALQDLRLTHCPTLAALAPLAACTALQRLDLDGCSSIKDLAPVTACTGLLYLTLRGLASVRDLSPLAAATSLHTLDLSGCATATSLAPLASCPGLQLLDLSGCILVQDLGPLAACNRLLELTTGCPDLHNLAPLAPCRLLRTLRLRGCERLQDLQPLASCTQLQELDLGLCVQLQDLGPLAACTALRVLGLDGCPSVIALRPLAACLRLEKLDIRGGRVCSRKSLKPLAGLTQLSVCK